MSSCTLNWYPDRGFELDLTTGDDEVTLRMVAVPVPVDGTAELREGPVALDRLEILFKAQVDVQGEPGQLQEASVQLITEEGEERLQIQAKAEDVESGELIPISDAIAVEVPAEAPERGGPRPKPPDEDDLDWEDETTLEQMIVNAPEASGSPEPRDKPPREGGLKALLDALASLGEESEAEAEPIPGLAPQADAPPQPATAVPVEPEEPEEPGDQRFSATQEAQGLLELLIERDGLELEDGFEVADLVPGVVPILASPVPTEAKAASLSTWLLDQPAVADLFLADDEIAQILEQW